MQKDVYKELLKEALDNWERQHPHSSNQMFVVGGPIEPSWVVRARSLLGRNKLTTERNSDGFQLDFDELMQYTKKDEL